MTRALSFATYCLVTAAASSALARPSLVTQLSATQVEVGQRFSIQVTCNVGSDDESPSEPRLPVPQGFSASGPSVSTQQSISIVNGRMERKSGVVATWILAASSTGRFRIGPASMVVSGQRIVDRAVEIEVVAAGASPKPARGRRRVSPFDPFDPFGGSDPFSGPMFPPMPGLKLDLGQEEEETLPAHPAELSIDHAKDPTAFLDARALPKRVVVGEQVRFNVYLYHKPGIEATGLTEPSLDGFLSYRSEHDDLLTKVHAIPIDGDRFFGRKILSYALFPTKTGTLAIGPTAMNFVARSGLLGGNNEVTRSSNALSILVEEPPLAGRPAFYHVGDTGQFKLIATVEPRLVQQGEAISVQVEVSGSGQLPQRLDPPEQAGVDWLEPSISQQIEEQRGLIGGRRQFSYVVRLNREGAIELGEFRFAYFDPTAKKYAIAKAPLGVVTVNPSGTANPTASGSASPGAPSPAGAENQLLLRGKLSAQPTATRPLASRPWFFYALAAGPLSTLGFFGFLLGLRTVQSFRKKQRTSAKAVIQSELELAKRALEGGELAKAASLVERAVHLTIEHRAGLRSRAILREDLRSKLVMTGLDDAEAKGLIELLERCDHLRFVQMDRTGATELFTDATVRIKSALAVATKSAGASE